MENLTLSEMFEGYKDIDIPNNLASIRPTGISLSPVDTPPGSLLFITEKANGETKSIVPVSPTQKPIAVVISKALSTFDAPLPQIHTGNVRAALAYALSNVYKIDYSKTKIIGITGSNGKTTTATLIYNILKQCGYKVGFIGTGKIISNDTQLSATNYSMTTPDSSLLYPTIARMSEDGCQYIVMEVSSHSIALEKVAPIKFEYGIFTNLDDEHLDFHKSKEEYFKTKMRLFSSCNKGLFNMDDAFSRKGFELTKCKKISFGILYDADTYATEIHLDTSGISFFYREKNLIFKVKSKLIGAFNVYNLIAAIKCVTDLGIKPCIAKSAVEKIDSIDGRMEIIEEKITVFIDYAHTPSAFYNCLKTIKQGLNNKQNLHIVFGCGGDRDKRKRPLFGKYAAVFADEIIITEDNCRNESFDIICSDIISGIAEKEYKIIPDRETAIKYALKSAKEGDAVAIVGKGHERYKIVGDNYIPFDEREIIRHALKERADEE